MNITDGSKVFATVRFCVLYGTRQLGRSKSAALGAGNPTSAIGRIYVINLDRKPDRWKRIKQELQRIRDGAGDPLYNLTRRLSAVDARFLKDLPDDAVLQSHYSLADQLFVQPNPLLAGNHEAGARQIQMTRQEVAVALSHIEAWQLIAAGEPAYTLVLEDDAYFTRRFAPILDDAWREAIERTLRTTYLGINDRTEGLVAPDSLPEVPEPTTRPGDLWILGEHRLLCGDATSPEDLTRLMDGERAALLSTDPPYLVGYTGADRPGQGKDWSSLYREVDTDQAQGFFRSVLTNALGVMSKDAAIYLWHAHKVASVIDAVWAELGILNHQQIIWMKPVATHTFAVWPWAHEPALMGWRKGHKPHHNGVNTHDQTSVWAVDFDGAARPVGNEHPTQKPVELFTRPIQKHTRIGEICLEPFSGSGTQIIAAQMSGRRCFAMEISPTFCDLAVRRWELFTGLKAELVSFARDQEG